MTTPMPQPQADPGPKDTAKKARSAQRRPATASQKAKPTQKAGPTKEAAKKRPEIGTARQGTKTAKILELLQRPSGATLKEITKATTWQPHSVRGFLSGTLRKRLGIRVDSFKRDDAAHAYRISSK